MLHSRAALASRVTEEEKNAGAACNTEGGAGFALPFRLVLQNPVPLDHLHFIPLTCIHWKGARIETCLLTSTVTNTVGLKKRVHIRSSAIPCFMEHFIVFPDGKQIDAIVLVSLVNLYYKTIKSFISMWIFEILRDSFFSRFTTHP